MENVIAAVFIVFILLFGVLFLSDAMLSAQEDVLDAWVAMEARESARHGEGFRVLDAYTEDAGQWVHLLLQNTGTARHADYSAWDAIAQYYDLAAPPNYTIDYLAYRPSSIPLGGEWTVNGLYLDAAMTHLEAFELGVWNPGEVIDVALHLSPPVEAGQALHLLLSTAQGVMIPTTFAANTPPTLDRNQGLVIASGQTASIGSDLLHATDPDQSPDALVFSVTTAPTQGDLTPADGFTQADIDAGLLRYAHTGTGDDSFVVMLSDGRDEAGPLSFSIRIDDPPVLALNVAQTLVNGGDTPIGSSALRADDPDTAADALVYTVVQPPLKGVLNLGYTFTQADLDAGLLLYTDTMPDDGGDSFGFMLSDDHSTRGPFSFALTE